MHPLLEQVRQHGNPVIEDDTVTFVWQGRSAPQLIDDLHGWEEKPQPLVRIAPGLWTRSFKLPRDAYLEYAFMDPRSKKRRPDPFNRKSVYNGVGGHNHYFYMPGADGPTPLTRLPRGGMRGRLTRHALQSFILSRKRPVYLYQPPVKEPSPLLVVYDGLDYLRRGRLAEIVDNLILWGRVRPLALAFVQNGGEKARAVEYACSEASLFVLTMEVLPLAQENLHLLDLARNPGSWRSG